MVVEVKGVVAATLKGVVAMAVVVKAMEARKASWRVVMAVVAVVKALCVAVAVAVALMTVPVMVWRNKGGGGTEEMKWHWLQGSDW